MSVIVGALSRMDRAWSALEYFLSPSSGLRNQPLAWDSGPYIVVSGQEADASVSLVRNAVLRVMRG